MEEYITPTSYQLSLACTELITQQDDNNNNSNYMYPIPTTPVLYPLSLSYPPTNNFSTVPLGHDPSGTWSDSSMSISSDDDTGNLSPIMNNGDELMSMLPGILEYQSMDTLMPTIDPLTTMPINATSSPFASQSQTIETLSMPVTLSPPTQHRTSDSAVAGFVNETPLSISNTRQDLNFGDTERNTTTSHQDKVSKLNGGRKSSTVSKKQARRKSSSISSGSGEIIKRFPCSLCPRSFARNHDLHRHMRVHTGDKPYICPCCNKGFARTDALKRHFKVEETCRLSPQVQNMKTGRRHSTL